MSWREAIKKPPAKPAAPKPKFETKDDDWETDTSYENTVTEKTQRYGSASVPGSGRLDHVDLTSIHEKAKTADVATKASYQEKNPNRGYGGKYGTEQVMDKSAADFSYKAEVTKHSSQTDAKKGFGGAHGIDERPQDKSAVGFDYKATVEKHSSQTDGSKGFGGKFGTDQNVQDKSAVGFSHKETVTKHSSQTDYTADFGSKQGVQKEEKPTAPAPIQPAAEPKIMEKPAAADAPGKINSLKAKFENIKKEQDAETAKRVQEERSKRGLIGKSQQQSVEETKPPAKTEPTTPRSATPPPSPAVETVAANPPENAPQETENPSSTVHKEEPEPLTSEANVGSILRAGDVAASAESSQQDNDDDEWAVEKNETNSPPTYDENLPVVADEQATEATDAAKDQGLKCIARYSYHQTDEDELGFEQDAIITDVQKNSEQWWIGSIGNRRGMFPASYVEECSNN